MRTGDESPADEPRHRSLERIPVDGTHNALWEWRRHRHPIRLVKNYIVISFCRIAPSLRLKNWLYRRLGMTVGPQVAWGLEATPDIFWPERITVGRDAIIGYDATILCHEFLQDELRIGEVSIGEGALIGAGAIILPGVDIGENAKVAANSLVEQDVPAGTTVAGVPARPVD